MVLAAHLSKQVSAIKPYLSAIIPVYFSTLPSSSSAVRPYSPSAADIHHGIGAICSLSLPVTSTHQLWKFMVVFGERQTKPASSNLLKYLLLFYPPDRPACTPRALRVPVGIVLCLPGGQRTGALIEYVVKHSARHYFTVIAGTLRLLQVLIIRRTRKRIWLTNNNGRESKTECSPPPSLFICIKCLLGVNNRDG